MTVSSSFGRDLHYIQEEDDRSPSALSPGERDALTRALLGYFVPDRKKASLGLSKQPEFRLFSRRAISGMIQSMHVCGLLEQSGGSKDAAYQLTPSGVAVKDTLIPNT